jgi:alkanesulfonate monooxygenase SsuD/methylene tetrahydromethanopterin reductase-like flavin-dependent oxidoreductase (luciferase family)
MTVGCLVFCAQFRPPRLLAKQLQTIDSFAPGRVVAGMGAGWFEAEFAEAGIPFERPGVRIRQLAEALDEMRDFFKEVPAPPLWVGGKGDRVLETAVAHADGWNTVWAWTAEAYKERLDVVMRACDRLGRDPATFTRSVGLSTLVGENQADLERRFERLRATSLPGVFDGVSLDDWREGRLVGTVEEVRDLVGAWRALGVAVLILNLGGLPFSVTDLDDLELAASALS